METGEEKLKKQNRRLKRQVRKLTEGLAAKTEVVPAFTPEPAKTEPGPEPLKVKKAGGRVWWQVGVGAALSLVAVIFLMFYAQDNRNMMLAVFFILFAAGGLLFLFMGLRKREEGITLVSKTKVRCPACEKIYMPSQQHAECPHTKIVPNCLNIYYGWDAEENKHYCDYIAFEEIAPARIVTKHPQKCLDDGKWYYVQIFDGKAEGFKPFFIPDMMYYSPKEFPNALQMPLSRKYAKPKATLGEKLRPVILLVVIGIEAVIMIATSGPPPA